MDNLDKQIQDLITSDSVHLAPAPSTYANLKSFLRDKKRDSKLFLNSVVPVFNSGTFYLTLLKVGIACTLLLGIFNIKPSHKNFIPAIGNNDTTQLILPADTNNITNYTDSICSIL